MELKPQKGLTKRIEHTSLNRTFVELKQRVVRIDGVCVRRLNRTFVELKPLHSRAAPEFCCCLNRTFVELKQRLFSG